MEVGPYITFYFDSYDTMWHQIQEMVYIEKGRARDDGKASSVQFVHFPFTPDRIAAFASPDAGVVIGFNHRNYGHMAIVPENVRAELTTDFT